MTNTEYLEKYDLLPQGTYVLCALSGGRDSVYLLHRLLAWAGERQLTVAAAHYNHHLRGEESQRDEDFVRSLCLQWQVPLYVGGGDVRAYAAAHGMGIEEAARTLRYAYLEQVRSELGADVIATAHHGDDQAETMLLQLARGAGARGLSGIPPRRGCIVRPILTVTRREIDGYLQAHNIAYVDDSTNALDDGARNLIRHHVIPILERINPAFVDHAARGALLLRADDQALQAQADAFIGEHPVERGIETHALGSLETPVAARVVRSLWGAALTADHVDRVLGLCGGEGLAYVHLPGCVVRRDRGRLWTEQDTPTPKAVALAGEEGALNFGNFSIVWKTARFSEDVHNSFNTFILKCESIKGIVTVSTKGDGDRIRLAGHSHTKKLKQLFQERGLTQPQRRTVPVIRDDDGVAAVYGFGTAQRCVPEIGDKIMIIQVID